jgi:hypothetical protein
MVIPQLLLINKGNIYFNQEQINPKNVLKMHFEAFLLKWPNSIEIGMILRWNLQESNADKATVVPVLLLISGAPFLGYHLPNCTDEQNSFAVRIPG